VATLFGKPKEEQNVRVEKGLTKVPKGHVQVIATQRKAR